MSRSLTRHPDSARAARALSAVLGFTLRELSAPWRHRPVVVARSAACLGLRLAGWSYPQIGTLLWRDHSTVMGACSAAECDPERVLKARQIQRLMEGREAGEGLWDFEGAAPC